MGLTRLVDLSHGSIGAVVLGVPTRATLRTRAEPIRSGGDNFVGDGRIDRGPWDITCSLDGQDPLSVPVVAALTGAQAVAASGMVVGSSPATYQKFNVAHAVLTGITLGLRSRQPGTVGYAFKNRGLPDSDLDDELQRSAGTARVQAARGRVVEFAQSGHTFTPDGGAAVNLEGIAEINWRAEAALAQSKPSVGAKVIDTVDGLGWNISGAIIFQDHTLTGGLAPAEYLATLPAGALEVVCQMAGYSSDPSPPTDQILKLDRLLFHGTGDDRSSGTYPDNQAEFSAVLTAAAGTALTLAQMCTWTPAA